jgi:hypothetical protein
MGLSEVGIVDASVPTMAAEIDKNTLADSGKLLIHEFGNRFHKVTMELDLVERGLPRKLKYDDLISEVDSMNRSLEELRAHLVRIEERTVALKHRGHF